MDDRNGVADPHETLDCLVIGGGPAGLTTGLYLARYGRRFLVVDAGDPRAAWIPVSHNIPFFGEGISGPDILARQQAHLGHYGVKPVDGEVTALSRGADGLFNAALSAGGSTRHLRARTVLLATGAEDIEPDLPDLPQAIRRGLVRYCPICDGYEVRGQRVGVIGHGARGLGEAEFIAATYPCDVTLLTLGRDDGGGEARPEPLDLAPSERGRAAKSGITVLRDAVVSLTTQDGRVAEIITADGRRHAFDTIYTALGLKPRGGLAGQLGAELDEDGAVRIDAHGQSSVPGLYAAGGVVRGLDQIVIAMGHAAVASTAIHNSLRRR